MNEQTSEPTNDSPEGLRAAMEKEGSVTAWISVDVEQLRAQPALTRAATVHAAADMIRDSLVRELAKHGIRVSRADLRESQRLRAVARRRR